MAEQTILMGRRIAQAREERGLTQAELAAEIPGKSDGTQISKWERGIHRPSDDTLEHIARALKKNVAWFLVPEPDKRETPALDAHQPTSIEERLKRIERGQKEIKAQLSTLTGHVTPLDDELRQAIITVLVRQVPELTSLLDLGQNRPAAGEGAA